MRNSVQCVVAAAVLLLFSSMFAVAKSSQPTIDELKSRLSSTSVSEKPKLCLTIAERQLDAADKLYAAVETEKAEATLSDVVAFSELARDYSIQSHKHQKQTEIAVRRMAHKLADIKRSVAHDEQGAVQQAIDKLQRVRDDLLFSMFPKKDDK